MQHPQSVARWFVTLASFWLILAGGARAAVWTVDGVDDLLSVLDRLEFRNVSLGHDGTVTLAPALKELATLTEAAVWQVCQDRSGALWLGTGNSARVFRLARPDAAPELVYDGTTGEILALTVGADGAIYFGNTPAGTIYRCRPGAQPESLLATGESYIFCLLADRQGTLYCATGDQGRLIAITPDGRMRTVFTAPQSHLTTMHWLVPDKELLVGTSPDGIVYRLDFSADRNKPNVSVLYDTPLDEVRAIVSSPGGEVYVAANSSPGSSTDLGPAQVYALRSSNLAWSWTCPESLVFALALRQNPSTGLGLLVGTGQRGLVYELDTMGRASILHRLTESQALSFLPRASRPGATSSPFIVSTGNNARLYELGTGYPDSGYLVSPPKDCDNPVHFGRLTFRGTVPAGTGLNFDTRTGSSQRPDSTWSEWTEAPGTVRSPSARFIQWRARFSSRFPNLTPALARTDLFFGSVNRPPQIRKLEVAELPLTDAKKGLARPRRAITWEASDPDSDSLSFDLYFKGENETQWKLLARDVVENRHEFDTRTLADGWYLVRLVASDRVDRPQDMALLAERTSRAFPVDNSPPQVPDLSVRHLGDDRHRVSFAARDALSPIVFGRLSVNAGEWLAAGPEDGLLDSSDERFSVDVQLAPGENVVAVWVADAQGNVGVANTVIRR